jgi:hypothetical protein
MIVGVYTGKKDNGSFSGMIIIIIILNNTSSFLNIRYNNILQLGQMEATLAHRFAANIPTTNLHTLVASISV